MSHDAALDERLPDRSSRAQPDPSNGDGRRATPWLLVALAATVLLLVYGNLTNVPPEDVRGSIKFPANLVVTALALALAGTGGFSRRELGLDADRSLMSGLWGFAIGAALATPIVLFVLLAPFVTGESVGDDAAGEHSAARLAWRALVVIPLGTAVPEEVLFRGVLFALWLRVGGVPLSIAATAVAFALWHVVISFDSVSNAGLDNAVMAGLGYVVILLGLGVGGIFFAVLRWQTGSIAAPIAVHWTINALGITAVWLRGQ